MRDAADHLVACLESLGRQTCADFEVIAVDDGSTDGSAAILQSWATADRRFRPFSIPAQGLVAALNVGLDHCRSDLVARMDADDRCHPERFADQLELLRDPTLDVVSCRVRHFPEDAVGKGFRIYEDWLNSLLSYDEIVRDRFIESPVAHPSVMVRRRALLAAGGYRDRGWPEDYDLWLRLAAAGARFAKVPRTLYFWRDHAQRLTRNDRRYAVERFLECKAEHLMQGPLAGIDRLVVWGAGQTGRRLSKHLLRRGAPIVAFLDIDPAKVGSTRRGKPILLPEDLPHLLSRPGRTVVLAAVSSRGARPIIRRHLTDLGLRETRDFWCAA